MIGSGVFIVAADISRQVQSPGLLMMTWVVTAVLTLIAALSYGELAAAMPHAGGQYVYLREAFGPLAGFLFGWTMFAVIQTGTIAAVAVAFAKYTGIFFPVDQRPELPGGQRRNRRHHAATARHRRHRLPHLEQHARHTHRRHGAERVHLRQDRRPAGAGGRGLPGGPQPRGGGQQLHGFLAQRRLELRYPCGWWASPWWARCSPPTPGTMSPSRPARCAIPSATCRCRWRSAWPSSRRCTSPATWSTSTCCTFDAIQHADKDRVAAAAVAQHVRTGRGADHGRGHHDLHLRLHQRPDPLRRARLLCDGQGQPLLPRRPERSTPRPMRRSSP